MRGKAGRFSRIVPPFDPLSLSGLTGWWDASDSSTLFDATTGGNAVAADGEVLRLEDKSGGANHFVEVLTGPTRKTLQQNGLDVVRFDGTDDYMVTSVASFSDLFTDSAGSVFIVAKAASVGTNNEFAYENASILAESAGAHGFVGLRSNDTVYSSGYDTAEHRASLSYQPGSWKVFTTTHDGSQLAFSINQASLATVALSTRGFANNTMVLGANWDTSAFFNGDVGEIIAYNVALSNAEQNEVILYLMAKWGIT